MTETSGDSGERTVSVNLAADVLRVVVGELDVNLQTIERTFGVRLATRSGEIVVRGASAALERCADFLEQLAPLIEDGVVTSAREVSDACRVAREDPDVSLARHFKGRGVGGNGCRRVFPRTARQREYCEAIVGNEIVIAIGPAGTGKTYLAVALAVEALTAGRVRRLVLCRPAVEAGERLGFLPGDMLQKIDPYLRPLYDALYELWDTERVKCLIEQGIVEVAPLAFMRGRTLNDCFVIIDEAQNTSPQQMKMLLTRIGEGSKMIVTGDITQVDLPRERRSGLVDARDIVKGIPGIAIVHFSQKDVVRHELVQRIVSAYEAHEERNGATGDGREWGRGAAPHRAGERERR